MSQHVYHVPATHFELPRRAALWLIALLVVAAIAVSAGLIASNGDDSTAAPATVTPSAQVGGPNETLRGQAGASAVGAQSSISGPNETLRGRSAAGATR
jgi:hypothetical protein